MKKLLTFCYWCGNAITYYQYQPTGPYLYSGTFLLNAILGVTGLVWAQPVVDVISLAVGIGMYLKVSRKMMKQMV